MIQSLIFVIPFFENIIPGEQLWSTRSSANHQSFFYSRICSGKSQSQLKPVKNITHFTIQFRSNNHNHFTSHNPFEIENEMLPKHSQKTLSVYTFSSKDVSVWCKKKHLHCTISWRPRTTFMKHFEKKCLYISVYLSKKRFVSKP